VKSLTRPNAMIERLALTGVTGVAAELVTTPLEHQRRRLNGSGMLLINAAAEAVGRVAAAAPAVAAACATFPGVWSLRLRAFGPKAS
jgi:23S rRNA A2030 N6-methylase RlmJ